MFVEGPLEQATGQHAIPLCGLPAPAQLRPQHTAAADCYWSSNDAGGPRLVTGMLSPATAAVRRVLGL